MSTSDTPTPLSNIEELALLIRKNLKSDASLHVRDDMWVITVAANALVVLDNVEQLEREVNALRKDKERLLGLLGDVLTSYDAPIEAAIRAELRKESQP